MDFSTGIPDDVVDFVDPSGPIVFDAAGNRIPWNTVKQGPLAQVGKEREARLTVKCLFLFRTSLTRTLPVRISSTTCLTRTDQIDLDKRSKLGDDKPRQSRRLRTHYAQIRVIVVGNHNYQRTNLV